MRTKILLLLTLLISLQSLAQSGIKAMGFVQEEAPGMVPRETGEPKSKPHQEHYIFLSIPKGKTVQPVEIWIRGEAYSLRREIVKPPVFAPKGALGKPQLMVSQTGNLIMKLTPLPYAKGKIFTRAREKAKANELVVVYRLNNTYYSATQKELTRLETRDSQ